MDVLYSHISVRYPRDDEHVKEGYFLEVGRHRFYLPVIDDLAEMDASRLHSYFVNNHPGFRGVFEEEGISASKIKFILERAVEEESKRFEEFNQTQNL
tara:strand:- start:2969 stop:3262 length:294 start_codon:yes stop_codon:yes gene_type:complete